MLRNFHSGAYYAKDSKGNIKVWSAHIKETPNQSVITYTFGRNGGKMQIQHKNIEIGKNIGKSNETTHYTQAIVDVRSKINKKVDKGYTKDKNNIQIPILPMLAVKFEQRKHNIMYPAYVQPKVDGVRMTCRMKDGKIEMFTRKGKPFTTMPHLEKELQNIFWSNLDLIDGNCMSGETFYLDGELYSDTMTFQQLAGAVRRGVNTKETLVQIKYVVFDCFDTANIDIPFNKRWFITMNLIKKHAVIDNNSYVSFIRTDQVMNKDDVYNYNIQYAIPKGYEGTIIRNKYGQYKLNHRSQDLQKFKLFQDEEFSIVGYKEADGNQKGCVVWQCINDNGDYFNVTPRGKVEMKREWFEDGDEYIGKLLTVRFQELTDDGIPRFPVGISIRDYE